MGKKTKKNIAAEVFFLLVTLAVGYWLYSRQGWTLLFREHQQIFLNDWGYVRELLFQPGGLAWLIGAFLTQTFVTRFWGAAVTAFILGETAWQVFAMLSRLCVREPGDDDYKGSHSPIGANPGASAKESATGPSVAATAGCVFLGWIPSILLAVTMFDIYFPFAGVIAFFIAAACLNEYAKITKGNRILCGLVTTLVLYLLAGSAAVLFAVGALVIDLISRKERALAGLAYIALALGCGLLYYLLGGTGTFPQSVTAQMFYDPTLLEIPGKLHLAWIALPVCLIIGGFFSLIRNSGTAYNCL